MRARPGGYSRTPKKRPRGRAIVLGKPKDWRVPEIRGADAIIFDANNQPIEIMDGVTRKRRPWRGSAAAMVRGESPRQGSGNVGARWDPGMKHRWPTS